MKILRFKLPKNSNESFVVEHNIARHIYSPLHQHPELQVTLILRGTGTAYVGGHIGEFKANDIFVIGSNVPHVFKNDDVYFQRSSSFTSEVIYIFFDPSSLGDSFYELPETKRLADLMSDAKRGIKVHGNSKARLIARLRELPLTNNLDKLSRLFEIFNLIATSNDLEYLSSEIREHSVDENEGKRLNDVIQFTMQEYHRHISLDEIADVANMTPSAFCRFFKQRTRKTYVNFLTEIRIGKACKMLQNKDMSVMDICYKSGFSNLSHFNRKFKQQTGFTPSNYHQKISAR